MLTHEKISHFQILSHKKIRILDLLSLKGELTKDLKIKILATNDLASIQDLYDSYASNGQTKASLALKMGMDHLANILWRQERNVTPEMDALAFFEEKSEVNSSSKALTLARDIIAERVRDNKDAKKELRDFIKLNGALSIEVIDKDTTELDHHKQYFPTSPILLTEKIDHIFKILEAESKGIVLLSINIPEEESLKLLEKFFIKKETACGQHVRMAIKDSYERFLLPSLEVEIRTQLLEDAFLEILGPCKNTKNSIKILLLNTKYLPLIPFILLGLLAFTFIPHPKPDGIIKTYYSNGQIKSIEGYLNGKRDGGFRRFLPNGQIVLFATYKNDVLDGESREYYDNGQWKTIKNYVDGQLEGFVQEYDQQGHLQHQVYYHNNLPLPKQTHE